MFESAELGHTVDDKTFSREEAKLRAELLVVQREVMAAQRFPVVVLINGMDGAGRGAIIHKLNEWLDARFVETRAFDIPTQEEREQLMAEMQMAMQQEQQAEAAPAPPM